ncbi:ethanolamine utilization protein EutJ [Desulfofundulus thermobenzoicus]|uniref:Ethanolamine utilization protein EutJ n=1 Tax=Desulfofundulus thermobenzoicus TaxID=29376 RepID=A0A6N7ITD0_9FIRM|nr:ethanolamine utilization protein EutJ [Desulfofundulus thermobenzoicus]MQL53312.1 ethanolamine utilization protein EutJ [Desulfofundulus thermobenzoicus]
MSEEQLVRANELISSFKSRMGEPLKTWQGRLRVGVDLGTANVVVAVVDETGRPVAGAMKPAQVVRDGLVVDYVGAVDIVRRLVNNLRAVLGAELTIASTAVPPGTGNRDSRATRHVVESAELQVLSVVDEPTAASAVLGVRDGAVVDVGGGTTGISILNEGKVVYTADEPTGGTHFTLVISGHYGLSFNEAEAMKLDPGRQPDLLPLVRPVMEKVAAIVRRHLRGWDVSNVYLVGGAFSFHGFVDVMRRQLDVPVLCPPEPLLVTPLGIALYCPAG